MQLRVNQVWWSVNKDNLYHISLLSLNVTFNVVFLIIAAVLTQICMTLKVVVYLSERRDTEHIFIKI